jgi:aryl-alcohol dehydrogenase-like predicted oxidoreductase
MRAAQQRREFRKGSHMTNRRQILTAFGTAGVAAALPLGTEAAPAKGKTIIPKRILGRTGHMVTPLALGGQASLQWTPEGVDAPDIIVRAVQLGVNYLDSANVYGPSQMHYGEAFRRLNLVPGKPNYDAALRERLYVASKTVKRFARDPSQPAGALLAVEELKRSLTQMFGDGQGSIPEGAYLDAIQIHALGKIEDIDTIYLGMKERGGKMPEQVGVFAALIDYRDGTNYTGLNPEHKRWVRHVGVTGHLNSPILMKMLRLDETNDLDTLLVALNVADKLYLPHQNNVLPLAVARGMGVIAMKVFADGAFVGKEAHWTRGPQEVVTTVGDAQGRLNTHDMVRYTLSLPGVSCAVIGTGHIDRKHSEKDQIVANLAAACDEPMGPAEREALEKEAAAKFGATTNYFQEKAVGLVQPTEVKFVKEAGRVTVSWQAGVAGAKPIRAYQIKAGGKIVLTIPARPQLTMAPLTAWLTNEQVPDGPVDVVASETI